MSNNLGSPQNEWSLLLLAGPGQRLLRSGTSDSAALRRDTARCQEQINHPPQKKNTKKEAN